MDGIWAGFCKFRWFQAICVNFGRVASCACVILYILSGMCKFLGKMI